MPPHVTTVLPATLAATVLALPAVPALETVNVFVEYVNVAVIVEAVVIDVVQGLVVPLQVPPPLVQPVNDEPMIGLAVSVTTVP